MKYLVALVIVVGLVAILRAQRRRQRMAKSATRPPEPPPPRGSVPARMLRCAACGVHLPVEEALLSGEKAFCTEDHRRQHQPSAED